MIGICLVGLALPQVVLSQGPVLDLAITDLAYVCLPGGTSRLDAEVQLATLDSIGSFNSEIRFFVDGIHVGSGFFLCDSKPKSSCEQLGPPCDDPINWCIPAIIGGKVVEGDCVLALDFDPELPDSCVCIHIDWIPGEEWMPGKSAMVCTAVIDPDDFIPEMLETNNSMTIVIGPSYTQGTVWGTIKSLYR
jgi:hypothetical protein